MIDSTQYKDLMENITKLSDRLDDIEKIMNAFKIDSQTHVKANAKITPGIATKVAYDENGLIIKGTKLETSDIPNLDINKINNLSDRLNNMINNDQLKKLEVMLNNAMLKRSEKVYDTGLKFNIDENGFVIDKLDVTEDDIPELSINKIEGLSDRLDLIESSLKIEPIADDRDKKVKAGTYPKITFDENGKVIAGSKLNIDDIPNQLTSQINNLESSLSRYATETSVNILNRELNKKLDANSTKVKSGTYTKVRIDENGLVTKGEKVTLRDLPEINISDIPNLEIRLQDKADQSDIIDLHNEISAITSALGKIGDINNFRDQLTTKASDSDLQRLSKELSSVRSMIANLDQRIPNERILDQLDKINIELSNLSGRLDYLERKLGVTDDPTEFTNPLE